MLETVREYALEQQTDAGEVAAVNRRHLEWSVHQVQPVSLDPLDVRRIAVVAAEHENLRAALRHAVNSGATEPGMWLAVALTTLWYVLGAYHEGRGWLSELLALPGANAPTRARAYALGADGVLAYCQGDYAAARLQLDQADVLAQQLSDELAHAVIVGFQGNVARRLGDLERALALYERCLRQFDRLGQTTWRATVLSAIGLLAISAPPGMAQPSPTPTVAGSPAASGGMGTTRGSLHRVARGRPAVACRS
jgi:tetratricopeptide (TPR) repeat protein